MTNFRVKIGGFLLGSDLKEKFDDFKPFTSDFKPANADFKIYAGLYYHSNNLWSPEVPDDTKNLTLKLICITNARWVTGEFSFLMLGDTEKSLQW